jgi:hypothetical protein
MMMSLSPSVWMAALLLVSSASTASAFAPAASVQRTATTTQLYATVGRREAASIALAGFLGAASVAVAPPPADAANPALETFKGRKKTKGCVVFSSLHSCVMYGARLTLFSSAVRYNIFIYILSCLFSFSYPLYC